MGSFKNKDKDTFFIKCFFFLDEFGSVSRYSKNRPIKEETNLDHTGWVCSWCYLVGMDLQNKFDMEIDFGKLLSNAVCHDMEETLTGDIPRPTKYYDKELRKKISEIEYNSICTIADTLEQLRTKKNLIEDWSNAKGTKNVEQFIVKMADLIGVVYKVWQEMIMLKNNCFLQVAEEIKTVIESTLETGFDTDFPQVVEYFMSDFRECLELLETCIESAHKTGVMPRFIKFP